MTNGADATAARRQAARLLAGVAARVPDLQLEAGLTDDEVHAVEQWFGFAHALCWFDGWGPRPVSTVEAVEVARERLAGVPQLVPVYGHRHLPSGRGLAIIRCCRCTRPTSSTTA